MNFLRKNIYNNVTVGLLCNEVPNPNQLVPRSYSCVRGLDHMYKKDAQIELEKCCLEHNDIFHSLFNAHFLRWLEFLSFLGKLLGDLSGLGRFHDLLKMSRTLLRTNVHGKKYLLTLLNLVTYSVVGFHVG